MAGGLTIPLSATSMIDESMMCHDLEDLVRYGRRFEACRCQCPCPGRHCWGACLLSCRVRRVAGCCYVRD